MNYSYIEDLVLLARNNDEKAKEELVYEFKPLILGIVKKTFVHGYEIEDLINEGYHTLFKCVCMYDTNAHRFVGYAANAIKNNINYLIEKSIRREGSEGASALTLTDKLEHVLLSDEDLIEEKFANIVGSQILETITKALTEQEKEILSYIVLKGHSIKEYAALKEMKYSTAAKKKNVTINKIKLPLLQYTNFNCSI